MTEPFRVAFVDGVSPGRWLRTWSERYPDVPLRAAPVADADQVAVLRDHSADVCFLRLPVVRDGLHVIPLYEEVPVVVAGREHPVAAFEKVDVADLAGEHLLQPPESVPEWAAVATEVRDGTRVPVPTMTVAEAVAVTASGAGILIVPMSLARLHHRRDVVHRPVAGVAGSRVGLAWLVDNDDPRVEDFIGVVRGRTANSSRGSGPQRPAARPGAAGRTPAGRSGRSARGRRRPGRR